MRLRLLSNALFVDFRLADLSVDLPLLTYK